MSRTRLEWAQWMAKKGITVFIVESDSKRPLGGHSWYERNSTDPEQIAEWFAEYENCNWGAHLGAEYVVIDLDMGPDKNGVRDFEDICVANGVFNWRDLPPLMVETPSGGYHLYFKTPHPCANTNSFPKSIDVRGAVGYVVGPGSAIKATGEWRVLDESAPIMEMPDWLLEYVEEPGRKDPNKDVPLVEWDQGENVAQAVEWLKQAPPAIEKQNGDDHTYFVCCQLRDYGVSEEKAFEILNTSGWNERCSPSWGDGELQIKIENSYRYAQNRPGVKAESHLSARLQAARGLHVIVDNTAPDDYADIADDDVPDDDEPDRGDSPKSAEPFWYGFGEFSALNETREYVVSEWLIAHGITGLIAKRGAGKSTVALDLGCHLACNMDWQGLPTLKGWCVIYICGEDSEGMILNARAWAKQHGCAPSNDRFRVARGIIGLTDREEMKRRKKEMIDWAAGRRCLVILDTWTRAVAGLKTNAQEEMDVAMDHAEEIARAVKGPMLACFHPPKSGELTIRGSGVQEDNTSGIWTLQKVADGILLTVERAKGAGEGNWRKFRIEKIALGGQDAHGRPIEGVVPVKFAGSEQDSVRWIEHQRANAELVKREEIAYAKLVLSEMEAEPETEWTVAAMARKITGSAITVDGQIVEVPGYSQSRDRLQAVFAHPITLPLAEGDRHTDDGVVISLVDTGESGPRGRPKRIFEVEPTPKARESA